MKFDHNEMHAGFARRRVFIGVAILAAVQLLALAMLVFNPEPGATQRALEVTAAPPPASQALQPSPVEPTELAPVYAGG